MARRSLLGGLLTVGAAAAAVAGVAYLFKEEIRETKTYKDLNEKYDVDKKIKDYSEKAKEAAKDIKSQVEEWKASQEDDIFEDDEIIIDGDFSEDRDYVSIKDAAEDVKEEVKDVAEDVKEAAEEAKDDVKDAVEEIKDNIDDAKED